jgi:hypothetical protein
MTMGRIWAWYDRAIPYLYPYSWWVQNSTHTRTHGYETSPIPVPVGHSTSRSKITHDIHYFAFIAKRTVQKKSTIPTQQQVVHETLSWFRIYSVSHTHNIYS